jgi:hypothetical protein
MRCRHFREGQLGERRGPALRLRVVEERAVACVLETLREYDHLVGISVGLDAPAFFHHSRELSYAQSPFSSDGFRTSALHDA